MMYLDCKTSASIIESSVEQLSALPRELTTVVRSLSSCSQYHPVGGAAHPPRLLCGLATGLRMSICWSELGPGGGAIRGVSFADLATLQGGGGFIRGQRLTCTPLGLPSTGIGANPETAWLFARTCMARVFVGADARVCRTTYPYDRTNLVCRVELDAYLGSRDMQQG